MSAGRLVPLSDQKPPPLVLTHPNCLTATASALSRSGAPTVPICSPRLRMMMTRQLRSLVGFLGRVAAAYERTVQERGTIPSIILDEPDKDAQEARLLAELGNPAFVIAHVIVEPPERKEELLPKAYVEDNVRRAESQLPPTPIIPDPPSPPSAPRGRGSAAGMRREDYENAVKQAKRFADGDDRADPDDLPLPPMRRSW